MSDFLNARPSSDSVKSQVPAISGSSLCLACGLCCNGAIHTHVVVQPKDAEHVRALGLIVESIGEHLGFSQPCPLYRESRCAAYPNHPITCQNYRCDLLKKYLAGTLAFDQALPIIQSMRALLADMIAQLPAGYSLEQVRREMGEDGDAGQGVFGSAEQRRQNAQFLLAVFTLARYAHKHFGKPKNATDAKDNI